MEKIEKLLTYLNSQPDDPFLKHALGLEYIKQGRQEEAKKLFLEILTRDPSYIGTYYHLAKIFESGNDPEMAKIWYEKGLLEAKKAGERHALNELQSALDLLLDES